MLFRKLFSVSVIVLLLSITLPLHAHDLPLGSSRWAFGSTTITGCIDFKPVLFGELPAIKEGHFDVHAISEEQLTQIASDIMQPYVNKKLSITVNGKAYPIKVSRLTKTPVINLYTLWLSVENVSFDKPQNTVKIAYSVLMEETGGEHMNLAFAYVTDATGPTLQRVFDVTHPAFQTTFDARNQVWELVIEGHPAAAAPQNKTEPPVASGSSGGVENPPERKSVVDNTAQESIARKALAPSSMVRALPKKEKNKPLVPSTPTVSEPSGAPSASITASLPSSPPTPKASAWTTISQFVPLGIEHILTGYDHIAFLLVIIVIGLSIKEVLKVITAFTIAHSVTLLLAAMDIIRLNSRFVESVIAFSICYVAVENLFKRKVHYRWVITFGFGLIHGFGFASALGDLISRRASLLLSVVSFNAGVEIGQLMVFFVMLPVLYLLKKIVEFRLVTVCTSVGVFALAFTWLVERVFSLKLLWF
jgi:hydrogenase/urease accessory protein HupE